MDYKTYHFSFRESLKVLLVYLVLDFFVSYFFYRSVLVFLILLPGIILYVKIKKKDFIKKRKKALETEFCEWLILASANMKSGHSIENAFLEARADLLMFFGEKSLMAKEVNLLKNYLAIHKTLEDYFVDLGNRSDVEMMVSFALVLKCAKRNGGGLRTMLEDTAFIIREEHLTKEEIAVKLSEKKLEFRCMEAMPVLFIGYIGLMNKGYFDSCYKNVRGVLFMSAALICYVAAVLIGRKILEIEF